MADISHYYPLRMTVMAPMPLPFDMADAHGGLPGSLLRAVFARAVAGAPYSQGGEAESKREAEVERLVASGKIRFLFAYPGAKSLVGGASADGDMTRSLPMFASATWPEQAERSGRAGAEWKLGDALAAGNDPSLVGGRGPRFRDFALYAEGSHTGGELSHSVTLAPEVVVEGMPLGATEDGRSKYGLAAGQTLVGMVQVIGSDGSECSSLIRSVRDKLKASFHSIGKWHRAGQDGIVSIEIGTQQTREASLLVFQAGHVAAGTVFRVLLTSPLVADGGDAAAVVTGAVAEAVGADAVRLVSHSLARDTGHATWPSVGTLGCPDRAKILAGSGSVFVFEALARLEDHQLLKLEHLGVGEGLADGFGRMVLMAAPMTNLRALEPPHRGLPQAPEGEAPKAVLAIQERLFMRAARRAADAFARDFISHRARGERPSSMIIARLRGLLSGEPGVAIMNLREWVSGGEKELPLLRRDALEAMGQGAQSLRGWLRSRIDGDQRDRLAGVSRDLGVDEIAFRNNLAGETSAANLIRLPNVADRLTVILIDAVLAAFDRPDTGQAHTGGESAPRGRPRRGNARAQGRRPGRGRQGGRRPGGRAASGTNTGSSSGSEA